MQVKPKWQHLFITIKIDLASKIKVHLGTNNGTEWGQFLQDLKEMGLFYKTIT